MTATEYPATAASVSAADVVAACADAVSALRAHAGEPAAAEAELLLRAETARIGSGGAHVVAVGEAKRGKSSLINAFVDRENLLPVRVDIATSTFILVRHGPEPAATVHYLADELPPRPIGLDEIERYAAVRGDDAETADGPGGSGAAGSGGPGDPVVEHVEVSLPCPDLADGLVLVDTPGVHGLIAGHTQMTLAAIQRADAVLFVVSARHELSRPELAFLKQATERVGTVLFAITHVDRYPWEAVRDRNIELLAEHANRFAQAPWYPVSSPDRIRAGRAAEAGNAALAARRLADSGFPALTEALARINAGAHAVRVGNAAHVARTLLEPAIAEHEELLRGLAEDPALAGEQAAGRRALAVLADGRADWRASLDARFAELSDVLMLGFHRAVNDLEAAIETMINTSGPGALARIAADLDTGVQGVWNLTDDAARTGVARIAGELGSEFRAAGARRIGAQLELPERLRQLPAPVAQTHLDGGVLAGVEQLMPAGTAGGLAALATTALVGGVAFPLLIGGAVTVGIMRRRRQAAALVRGRADAERHLRRVLTEVRTEAPAATAATLGAARTRMIRLIEDRLAAEQTRLAGQRERLAAAARDREQARARSEAALAQLRAIDARLARYAPASGIGVRSQGADDGAAADGAAAAAGGPATAGTAG
jgi:hypothetical protein